ncbi:hypothetical protein GCM10027258_79690 [Amycolatopsis stemonae]
MLGTPAFAVTPNLVGSEKEAPRRANNTALLVLQHTYHQERGLLMRAGTHPPPVCLSPVHGVFIGR